MAEQEILPWNAVRSLPREGSYVWTLPRLSAVVSQELSGLTVGTTAPQIGVPNVVVISGGSLIDRAKFWRREQSPETWLCAVPSLWGSGAEASPIATRIVDAQKVAVLDPALRPDARSIWPALAQYIPDESARWGMGDAWAHALEGFLSPLAEADLRQCCASFIATELLPADLAIHPRWFDLSSKACTLQAQSGVGLVHAIAHVLEPQLEGYGHARLCSLFLWPVFAFNRSRSPKLEQLCAQYGLDPEQLASVSKQLFVPADFHELVPSLTHNWQTVVRHPLARINCTLVRPDALPQLLAAATQ